jgi:hypothetical protein
VKQEVAYTWYLREGTEENHETFAQASRSRRLEQMPAPREYTSKSTELPLHQTARNNALLFHLQYQLTVVNSTLYYDAVSTVQVMLTPDGHEARRRNSCKR